MNEFLRRMLFLPEQASSVARRIDSLHYFVIITALSPPVRNPDHPDDPASPLVGGAVRAGPSGVLPRLVRARLSRLRLHQNPSRRIARCLRDGQAVDVEVRLSGRSQFLERAAGSGPSAGSAAGDLARRDSFLLRAVLSNQAGRGARPVYRGLVRGGGARALPGPLRRVLWDQSFQHARRSGGDAPGGIRYLAGRTAAGTSRSAGRHPDRR